MTAVSSAGGAREVTVNHVGLCVADLERSQRFYGEVRDPDGQLLELILTAAH